jgi:hypothetical protein
MAPESFPSVERLRLSKGSVMNSKFLKWMVLPQASLTPVSLLLSVAMGVLVNEPSEHSEESTTQVPLPGTPTINVFFTCK